MGNFLTNGANEHNPIDKDDYTHTQLTVPPKYSLNVVMRPSKGAFFPHCNEKNISVKSGMNFKTFDGIDGIDGIDGSGMHHDNTLLVLLDAGFYTSQHTMINEDDPSSGVCLQTIAEERSHDQSLKNLN
eukprot:396997_1